MHYSVFCIPFKGIFEFSHFLNSMSFSDTHSGAIFIAPSQVCFSLPLTPFFSSILITACGAPLRAEMIISFQQTIRHPPLAPPPPPLPPKYPDSIIKTGLGSPLSSFIANRLHQKVISERTHYYQLILSSSSSSSEDTNW